jgi:hypothetical protein
MSDTEDTTAAAAATETAAGAGTVPELTGTEHLAPEQQPKPAGPSAEERGFQGRFNKLNDSLKPLRPYLDDPQLQGPKGISMILANGSRLWANPQIAEVMRKYLDTGVVEFPKPARSADGLDFDTPEPQPWESETTALKAEVAGLRNMLRGVQKNVGMRSITDHTAKFRREYPMTPEEQSRFEEAMDSRIDRLSATDAGVQVLQSMSWDDYRSMALPAIEDFRDAISERKRQAQRAANANRATDAPGIGTGGEETPRTAMPRNRAELKEQAKRALRAVQG